VVKAKGKRRDEMKDRRNWLKIASAGLLAAGGIAICAMATPVRDRQPSPGYHFSKKVMLGGKGFWDYLAIDTPARHVFITNNTRVLVIDADKDKVVGEITDPHIDGVHGVAVVNALGRGFTSNGATNTVTIFDLKTLKPIGTVKTGKRPDAIIYDPASSRVFTFNGESDDATAIVPSTGTVAATIALGGRPEFAAADGAGGVFVNIENKNEVVRIDSRGLKVSGRWPTAPCVEPSGMAVDQRHSRLFIGCHNKMMAVMDSKTGKIVATPSIGERVDANRFDSGTALAFSSNGDGTLTVIHEDSPDKYTVRENVKTEIGARTMEVDPDTHNVYLVSGDLMPTPPTAENPHPHPTVVPGTMRLLIYKR
jgi:DNA-binding beta-propeller fold protein YncE